MVTDNRSADLDCRTGKYDVRFDPREVSDLEIGRDDAALATVAQVSRFNEAAYSLFVSPWLSAAVSPASAEALREFHPKRWTRTMFSERGNPWMALVKSAANTLRETRQPLPDDHPAILAERRLLGQTREYMAAWRKSRDAAVAFWFGAVFGNAPDALTFSQAGDRPASSQEE